MFMKVSSRKIKCLETFPIVPSFLAHLTFQGNGSFLSWYINHLELLSQLVAILVFISLTMLITAEMMYPDYVHVHLIHYINIIMYVKV